MQPQPPTAGIVRLRIVLSLLVITPLGFASKFYTGPGSSWANDYGGGVLYVVFWCLLAFFFWPRRANATRIAVGVLAVTVLLEVLQIWHPPVLEMARATFLGRTLLGTTFSWWDLPHYVLGSLLGWVWIRLIS